MSIKVSFKDVTDSASLISSDVSFQSRGCAHKWFPSFLFPVLHLVILDFRDFFPGYVITHRILFSRIKVNQHIPQRTLLCGSCLVLPLDHRWLILFRIRSSLDGDMIRYRCSNILPGSICWIVTWKCPKETFNLFSTKC